MQCNIDARGKVARLIGGLLAIVAAGVLAALLVLGVLASDWWWAGVAGLGLFGAFGIFEARAGWCAMRAMGFKTPI